MVRNRNRKPRKVFVSKADTPEMRAYQQLASQYPPLTHEEHLALSRRFIKGRDAAVALEEQKVVDAVVGGDWSDEALLAAKDDVIAAYETQIDWLLGKMTSYDLIGGTLREDERTPAGLYAHRKDNLFAAMPWMEPVSVATVLPEVSDMDWDEFIENEPRLLDAAINGIDEMLPSKTPRDVTERWKYRLSQLKRRYLVNVRSLDVSDEERRRMRFLIRDSRIALEEFVNHNIQFAMSRVSRFMKHNPQRGQEIGPEELICAANVGLVLGAREYDPEKGRAFSTYAAYHIDGQLHELSNIEDGKSGIQGMTNHEQKQLRSILDAKGTFGSMFGREPTLLELQSLTGISKALVKERLATPQVHTQNIYSPISRGGDDDGSATLLADTIASDTDVERAIEKSSYDEMLMTMKRELMRLPEDSRTIVLSKFGLIVDEMSEVAQVGKEKNIKTLSSELNMTQAEINRKYAEALASLRGSLELRGWDAAMLSARD